jgi:hypothetical protein
LSVRCLVNNWDQIVADLWAQLWAQRFRFVVNLPWFRRVRDQMDLI